MCNGDGEWTLLYAAHLRFYMHGGLVRRWASLSSQSGSAPTVSAGISGGFAKPNVQSDDRNAPRLDIRLCLACNQGACSRPEAARPVTDAGTAVLRGAGVGTKPLGCDGQRALGTRRRLTMEQGPGWAPLQRPDSLPIGPPACFAPTGSQPVLASQWCRRRAGWRRGRARARCRTVSPT